MPPPRLLPTLALLLLTAPLPAAEARGGLRAGSIQAAPIYVDGRLDEAAWEKAEPATGFTQNWPEFGQAHPLPTEVRLLCDGEYLYVGARMCHPKGASGVVARVHRRDQESPSDWFGVYIDSLHDRQTAYAFLVNAGGVQRDGVVLSGMDLDATWDGVWESAVQVDEAGWTAELKIPLSLLRVRSGEGPRTWGINFSRSDAGSPRASGYWALPPRDANAFVSRFPELRGLEGVRPRPRREWLPFVSTQRKTETAQAFDDRGWTHRAGLDAHLGLGGASQLDLAVKPDFGQVEVDQSILNLGTLETYLPEKRPFFLEGMEIFQTVGPQLFYSRRIGRGLGHPDLEAGERLLDSPGSTEIEGAAKFTGKFDGGLQLGFLGAQVGSERAELLEADGGRRRVELAPTTRYGVLRAKQGLDARGSYVGAMATQARESGATGRTGQGALLDGRYRSASGGVFEAAAAWSRAGRKDQTEGDAFQSLSASQRWGRGWSLYGEVLNVGRDFDIRDLGYLSRPDYQRVGLDLSRQWDRTWRALRNWSASFSFGLNRDQAGRVYQKGFALSANTETTGFFSAWVGLRHYLAAEDDRELRSFRDPVKKYLQVPAYWRYELGADTPGNLPWYLNLSLSRSLYEGGPTTSGTLTQVLRPGPRLELKLETTCLRAEGERRFLEQQAGQPVAGLRRMSQFDQVLRVSYAFTPRLSLQTFGQWMAASYAYRDLRRYVDDRRLAPVEKAEGASAFSERVATLNAIARWEFRPGSTLFAVYTRGVATDALIDDRATLRPGRDLSLLNHLPADEAVQLKLSVLLR